MEHDADGMKAESLHSEQPELQIQQQMWKWNEMLIVKNAERCEALLGEVAEDIPRVAVKEQVCRTENDPRKHERQRGDQRRPSREHVPIL
jgi:hypothetical protein